MGYAEATIDRGRIMLRTVKTRGVDDFGFMLAASKKVNGGRFSPTPFKHWHYPLSIDTCKALRRAFGDALRVGPDLAAWYRQQAAKAAERVELGAAEDAELRYVPAKFANWLRGYQRAGAKWIATGYRGCGIVADHPGMGKTPETLAALIEGGVQGPVLVVCPKASVKSVWGNEARAHLRGVPTYLCRGNREQRQRVLALFAEHMRQDPDRLRIVVVVAEMLRVKLGNPCFTFQEEIGSDGLRREFVPKNKISGMCPALRRGEECTRHIQVPPPKGSGKSRAKKWLVPTGFEYPELFDDKLLAGGWSWLILDESHKLLGSLTVAKANLMGRGLRLLPERTVRRYALSGTPYGKGGRVEGMFGTLHWCWPDEFTSFWKWARDVLDVEDKAIGYDRATQSQKTAPSIIGPKGLRANATAKEEMAAWEDFLAGLGPRILRRTKGEMLKWLPPKTYSEVVCEMTAAQAKQYQELLDFAEVSTPSGTILANGHLALRLRSQQLANGSLIMRGGKARFSQESGKLDKLWEALEQRGVFDKLPGVKMVIASRYNEFLDAIEEMVRKEKASYYRLDGTVSDSVRNSMMNAWQTGKRMGPADWAVPPRLMLVNTKAAGISINLDAADEMHIMDEDPDPGVNEQLEDRIHRASREHQVFIYYYRTEGTLDYAAAHDTEMRRRMQHAVMDGRRGVTDERAEEELLVLLEEALKGK